MMTGAFVCLWCFVLASVWRVTGGTFTVMMSGDQLQKLFFGSSKGEVNIVDKGVVSKFLKKNLTEFLPPISADFNEFELHFSSPKRLYYQMYLNSSDTNVMYNPTVTIPYKGRLMRRLITFKIRFPCTKRQTGVVRLGIVIDFFYNKKRTKFYKRLDMSMQRQCIADSSFRSASSKGIPSSVLKDKRKSCKKQCDMTNFNRKFCLADWVARVKVKDTRKTTTQKGGTSKSYFVRVPRKAVFKRPVRARMTQRFLAIESRGNSVTCDCKPLRKGEKYLVFGKETFRGREGLFLDNFSMAFHIPSGDQRRINLMREFRRTHKSIRCPAKLSQYRYFGRNLA